jgi:hypothetical protein
MIEFPNIAPQKMTAGLTGNTKTFTSTFNNSVSAVSFAGSYITASLTFSALDSGDAYTVDEADDMSAFIFEVSGMSNSVKLPMFHRPGAEAKGTPLTSVAGQLGGQINTKGWTPNTTVLKRGNFFTVNNELKMCLNDIVSDSSGNALLTFAPWMRASTVINASIITKNPYGIFRLTDDSAEIDFEPSNGSVTLEFREDFYV